MMDEFMETMTKILSMVSQGKCPVCCLEIDSPHIFTVTARKMRVSITAPSCSYCHRYDLSVN